VRRWSRPTSAVPAEHVRRPHACPASVAAPNMLAGLSVWAVALVNHTPFAGARDYVLDRD
jgi:hypothetical protein